MVSDDKLGNDDGEDLLSDGIAGDDTPESEADVGTQIRPESDDGVGSDAVVARDLLSARPFVRGARMWRDAGWEGTIPLPARAKNPPPTGWTGRNAGFPSNSQISDWCKQAEYKKGNIGLHLGFPIRIEGKGSRDVNGNTQRSGEYEVIGIDVDNYEDNGKIKKGAEQLSLLESQLGSLPRTCVSTARASRGDYNSGIRFFLVPRGLAFRGQVDKDIEVIQKSHRFAVVWPSYNPKSDSQYCLYHPDEFFGPVSAAGNDGSSSTRATGSISSGNQISPLHEVPHVTSLPRLPEKWLDYLTNGKMLDTDGGIDMDSTVDEIEAWAFEQFNDPDDMCVYTRKVLGKWKKQINDEATSHDKIRDAHWELANCGAEAHTGWNAAINEIDRHWIQDIADRNKRPLREMRGELFRSKINAFRKVKVKVENATSAGGLYTNSECVCAQRAAIASSGGVSATLGGNAGGLFISDLDTESDDDGPPDGLDHVSWGNGKSPDEYDMNDDGNGEFLCDLLRYKAGRVKWIEGYGWIVWTDGEPGRPSRWLHDSDGLIRRAFWRVKRMQAHFAEQKADEADQMWAQSGRITPMPADVKAAFAIARKYSDWATRSGNNRQAEAAITAAQNYPDVSMNINDLNNNMRLMGVANGVIELRTNGAYLREAEKDDFITLNTNVPWTDYEGIPSHDHGKKLWEEYLDKFVPDSRRTDYQTFLGYCLLGGNVERLLLVLLGGTSTGKSTMLRALGAALGDYASTVNLSIFENHKLNPALANAMPKRVVFTSELSAGDSLSVASIKRLTGDDVIRAELKGSNVEVEGIPQFVPIMATNTAPHIDGADEALKRRLTVLSFDQRIEDRKDKKGASSDLAERSQECILAWLIEGYNMYCKNGLPKNLEIIAATEEFAAELDHVSEFVKERIRITAPDDKVSSKSVYKMYEDWCETNGVSRYEKLNKIQFTKRLCGLGLEKPKNSRIDGKLDKTWFGIKLTRVVPSVMKSVPMTTESEEKENNGKQN